MKKILLAALPLVLLAQPPQSPPEGFGPGGAGGPGRGGFGPMMQETKLVAQFDTDGDKHLNAGERAAAREFHLANKAKRGGPGGPGGRLPGGRGGRGGEQEPTSPGEKLRLADVKAFSTESLYDTTTLRTLFIDFADAGWEKEMEDFYRTDVDVPAQLSVDGKSYPEVGVHFRGNTSYMMVGTSRKRSLHVSIDSSDEEQNLLGFRALNLLNSHDDASFLRAPLYSFVAQHYIPTPKVNFVRVVIGGENWGIYASAEHFNKDFLKSRFGSSKGARWKVQGSPGGRGGFAYLGDDPAAYKRIYDIRSKDDDASWWKLIRVTKIIEQTEPEKLEAALGPLFDINGALKFLALDTVFANGDGFWTRTSDYTIGEDKDGRLHMIPHDMNETFSFGGGPGGGRGGRGPGGPGGADGQGGPTGQNAPDRTDGAPGAPRGEQQGGPGEPGEFAGADGGRGFPPRGGDRSGPGGFPGRGRGPGGFGGGGGVQLDPLAVLKNSNAVIAQKLLAVPALRTRYLGYVRDMATTWLDWSKLGPVAQRYHDLIDADVKRDTRKLESYDAFVTSLEGPRGLKAFADQRRVFLLGHEAIKALPATAVSP